MKTANDCFQSQFRNCCLISDLFGKVELILSEVCYGFPPKILIYDSFL